MDVVILTNRMIAERAGWRTRPSYCYDMLGPFKLALGERANGVGLYTPDGTPVPDTFEPFEQAYRERSFEETAKVVWEWAADEGLIPNFLHDCNAALTLLSLVGGEWSSWKLQPAGIDLMYSCVIIDFMRQWRGQAATPAEAICKAWWAWQESQSHHKA